jgi:tetratricopeptide (TPR) repeat protein
MSIKNNLAKAEAHYHKGEFEQAITICQKVLAKKPKLFNAVQVKAACYQGLGDLDSALSLFKYLITINDKHASTHNNIGNIYLAQKNYSEASKFYFKAQKTDPQMAEPSNNLAICQQKLGDFSLAEANYKKAIMLDGKVADYHYNLGVLFADLGYFEPAIKILLKTLELDKNKSSVYWYIVECFMYQHRYQDALEAIDMGLLSNTLSDEQLCELLVAKAMLFWLFYSPEEVEQVLKLSNSIYSYENDSANMNNMIIFHRYIRTLLENRRKQKKTASFIPTDRFNGTRASIH